MHRRTVYLLLLTCLILPLIFGAATTQPTADWPESWIAVWNDPPAECRPLQIVHAISSDQASPEAMGRLKASGLGGIVCNVAFNDYLQSEENWAILERAVESCQKAGLIVWIYDEKGYPSGAAGGEVLRKNADLEAQAMTFDASQPEPYAIRRAFEHAHASNNYYACRRYPNIIDKAAMQCFINMTHDAYAKHLGKYFGTTIRAFFTDEPSLMSVNIGQLPDNIRKTVAVVDPIDPNVKLLPMIPWTNDLPELYRKQCSHDLLADRSSLFTGNSNNDRQIRGCFWSLIADLVANRYFGQIQEWCRAHKVASSGHTLHEEQLFAQVPLAGNTLQNLSHMDIPGMDLLTSEPHAVVDGMWLTATLPVSAALLNDRRLVMTEVSDFAQKMATGKPASLEAMQATAAWQAALGVTEFTLYYDSMWRLINQFSPETERENRHPYTNYVGRLNALLRDAQPETCVLLYYPIQELQTLYMPIAGPITLESQSPRIREIIASFNHLGRELLTHQIPFLMADAKILKNAIVQDGKLVINGRHFTALALPTGEQISKTIPAISQLETAGGIVLRDGEPSKQQPLDVSKLANICPLGQMDPPCADIVMGRFMRQGRHILLLVNTSQQIYTGSIAANHISNWSVADPATGKIETVSLTDAGRLAVKLDGHTAIMFISDIDKRH